MATGYLVTNVAGIYKAINEVVKDHVLKKLYIQLHSKKLYQHSGNSYWISKQITKIYSSTSQNYPNLDIRIVLNTIKKKAVRKYDIDVLILPKTFSSEEITSLLTNKSKEELSVVLLEEPEDDDDDGKCDNTVLKMYNNVLLGGTFDRLHAGHKILLSQALLHCSERIIVGVTDANMITGKKLWELIEPCIQRIRAVQAFLEDVDNTVSHEVVSISDIYGPSRYDNNLDMLMVSEETMRGALKVNEYRKENGLSELEVCMINIVEESNDEEAEEKKISSSNIRLRLLGTRIREPEEKPGLPSRPYIIGLTGGICSGKSNIAEFLRTLGAHVINCDKIAHQLYRPGTEIYFELIKIFGNEILYENGEINRSNLGEIVFNDSKQLDILNQLLWPCILKESLEECKRAYEEDKKNIVILEAAVLLRAGWCGDVHEVWTSIIPEEEAILRLKNRNNLTEEQAKLRLQSQPSNSEQIAIANVVFCTLWSYEFTRRQVEKAWAIVSQSVNCSL